MKQLCVMAAAFAVLSAASYAEPNWSGPYIGAHAGVLWGTAKVNIPNYVTAPNHEIDLSSAEVGFHGGYDYDIGEGFLIGLVGDFTYGNASSAVPSGLGTTETYSVDYQYDYTIRAKIGYVFETDWAAYVTGGWAGAQLAKADFLPDNGWGPRSADLSGFTIGAGVNWAATDEIILGVQYLYKSYENVHFVYNGPVNVGVDSNVIEFTLDWKFL